MGESGHFDLFSLIPLHQNDSNLFPIFVGGERGHSANYSLIPPPQNDSNLFPSPAGRGIYIFASPLDRYILPLDLNFHFNFRWGGNWAFRPLFFDTTPPK